MNARRYGWALVYALVGVALVLLLLGLGRIGDLTQAVRDGQTSRAPLFAQTNNAATAAKMTAQRIEACTTPGRPCYDRSQRRLASTVLGINVGSQKAASAAAACAASLPDPSYRAVYRCVVRTLGNH